MGRITGAVGLTRRASPCETRSQSLKVVMAGEASRTFNDNYFCFLMKSTSCLAWSCGTWPFLITELITPGW